MSVFDWAARIFSGVSMYQHEKELRERDNIITDLREQLEAKHKLASHADDPYFWIDGDPVPFCPKCWQSDGHKEVRIPLEEVNGGTRRTCVVCGYRRWEKAPQGAQVKVNHSYDPYGSDGWML